MVVEQPGKVAVTVCEAPLDTMPLKVATAVVVPVEAGTVKVTLLTPSVTVSMPAVGLVIVTVTVLEKVLVAVLQSPGVATALTEHTGATEQLAGAVYVVLAVGQADALLVTVTVCTAPSLCRVV